MDSPTHEDHKRSRRRIADIESALDGDPSPLENSKLLSYVKVLEWELQQAHFGPGSLTPAESMGIIKNLRKDAGVELKNETLRED